MNLNASKLMVFALVAISIGACSKDKENPTDYWKLLKPRLSIFESQKEFKESQKAYIKQDLMSFNDSNKNVNIVGYSSYIEVDESTKVNFTFTSKCVATESGEVFQQTFGPETIYKKIYLYKYLPEKIISKSDLGIIPCAYKIKVVNEIGSSFTFFLKTLNYSTTLSNKINLVQAKEDQKISVLSEDLESGYIKNKYLDFSEETANIYTRLPFDLKGPKAIKEYMKGLGLDTDIPIGIRLDKKELFCDGYKTKLYDNNDLRTDGENLKLLLDNFGKNSNPYLLKNCRLVANIAATEGPSLGNVIDVSSDLPKVWSPYFDIVFVKPNITIDPIMKPTPLEDYKRISKNGEQLVVASFRVTNHGEHPVAFSFSKENINLGLEVLVGTDKLPVGMGAKMVASLNSKIYPDLRLDVPELISPNAYLQVAGEISNDVSLGAKQSIDVDLVIEKNFSCNFDDSPELAFWMQGFDIESLANTFQVYSNYQGALSDYPEIYRISDFLEKKDVLNPGRGNKNIIYTAYLRQLLTKKDSLSMSVEDYTAAYYSTLYRTLPKRMGLNTLWGFASHSDYARYGWEKKFNTYCRIKDTEED